MILFSDILRPDDVVLEMLGTERCAVINEVAARLQNDERVLDWHGLREALHVAAPCIGDQGADFSVLLPHARTEAVSQMVMSVARMKDGFTTPDAVHPVRYVFCIGVPRAMAADYLRLVGLLARLLRDRAVEAQLRAATSAEEFVAVLSRLEAKL